MNESTMGQYDDIDMEGSELNSLNIRKGSEVIQPKTTSGDEDNDNDQFGSDTKSTHSNFRKMSVETVLGGSYDRFCLKSEEDLHRSDTKSFISHLDILQHFGPRRHGYHSEAGTYSPNISMMTLEPDLLPEPTEEEIFAILKKSDIADEIELANMEVSDIYEIKILSQQEKDFLVERRTKLIDDKRKEDIFKIIDDMEDTCFKKN